MRALAIATAAAILMAAPAGAQVERLPEQSRAERQVEDLNRAMVRQQMQTRQSQQTQFEINQLRNQIQRNTIAPIGGGSISCPAGSIGC